MVTARTPVSWWEAHLPPSEDDDYFYCPVCGGHRLHVSAPDGDPEGNALLHCFSSECAYRDIILTIDPDATNGTGPKTQSSVPHKDAKPVVQPADARDDPKAWLAKKTGTTPEFLDTLPISFSGGYIRYRFKGLAVVNYRQAGTKVRGWTPPDTHDPPLWPLFAKMGATGTFTEGQTDCIALRRLGMKNVYAITGGASSPPSAEQFRDMKKRGLRHAVIAFDADDSGRKGAEKAMTNVLAAGLGVSVVFPTDYDSLSGKGKDWCEWVAAGGTLETFPSPDTSAGLLTITDLAELMPTEYDWIVDPIIFPTGMTVIAGLPKSGKSTFVVGLSADLGRGLMPLPPTPSDPRIDAHVAPVKLIWLSEEPGPPIMDKHRGFGLREDTVYYTATLMAERGQTPTDVLLMARAQAKRWVSEGSRVLIAVDSFEVWAGLKDENDAPEVTRAVQHLRGVLATTGAAVIVIHHLRKGGGERGEALRGSGALAGAFDLVIEYGETTGDDKRERAVNIRGRLDRSRGEQFMRVKLTEASRFVLLSAGDGTATINPHYANPMTKVGNAHRDMVLAALPGTVAELVAVTGFVPRTVKEHLGALRTVGLALPVKVDGQRAPRWEQASGVQDSTVQSEERT